MNLRFMKSSLEEVNDLLQSCLNSLSSPIDSYMEERILLSEHFLVLIDNTRAGYFSIENKAMITQFYLDMEYRYLAQKVFYEIKKMQTVQKALVPTCDEFFLTHALDEFKSLDKQAYFFKDARMPVSSEGVSIRLARLADEELIVTYSGDFFDKIAERIGAEEIYIATQGDTVVGFGLIIKGILMQEYASLGMYTVESVRQQGIGRSILILLKEVVYENELIPLAGCWYYNHYSKKTLESAGMYSDTRLLKVNY